jgi:hypothetical protein
MSGNKPKGVVIQERDRQLLRELSVMRVIDREQAKIVAGFKSTTRVNARLLLLTNVGLLKRFFLGTSKGGMKALYALSPKGAQLVHVPDRGPRRKQDQVLAVDQFCNHQLLVNSIYCIVKYRPIPDAKFIRWVSISEPLNGGLPLVSDGYFELSGHERVLSAFLEVDLGSESLRVWKAKVQNYLSYAVSGVFKERFGQPQFRVLVITDSERRMNSIRSVVAATTDKIFWFTTFESIRRCGFWAKVWLRPKGVERQALL